MQLSTSNKTNFVTLSETKNISLIYVFFRHKGGVRGKILYGHFYKHRNSILNMPNQLDRMRRNRLGGNDTIHDQSLRKDSNKKLKIED